MKLYSKVITPYEAIQLLCNSSPGQPPINALTLDLLVLSMQQGWFEPGLQDPLRIINGQLWNGQHQLLAAYLTNTSHRFLVLETRYIQIFPFLSLDNFVKRLHNFLKNI